MKDHAELARSAHARVDLAESLDRLPWLCPGVDSLTALTRPFSPDTWTTIRRDPAAVLLTLRQPGATFAERLETPALFEETLQRLDGTAGLIDWNLPALRPILHAGLVYAQYAEAICRALNRADDAQAWIAALLAPLGWYAAAALDGKATEACLGDPELAKDPAATQRRHWGVDAEALARRLARRYELPGWLAGIIGHLSLSPECAAELGADGELFHIVRLTIGLAREAGCNLLTTSGTVAGDAAALGLFAEDVKRLAVPIESAAERWQDPRTAPWLRDLLGLAAENRRLRRSALQRTLEAEVDQLHDALAQQAKGEGERLQAAKLAAMAEFAAGAGHEINNPLAVISGQAQYVLSHAAKWLNAETAETPRKSLQVIITQTKRIHGLLRDLFQFARPSAPRPMWFDLAELLPAAASLVRDLAEQRRVRLELHAEHGKVRVRADREQLKTALTNLLRNAIEAAPAEGWARVTLGGPARGRVAIVVEDNGHGLDETQLTHLFDPFYSGRSAGRGPGLGLPTAWRLARLQGGDVRCEQATTPTRFVLEIPWVPEPAVEPTIVAPPVLFTETVQLHGTAMGPV